MATYNGLLSTYYNDSITSGSGIPTDKVFNKNGLNESLKMRIGRMGRTRNGRLLNDIIKALTGSAVGEAVSNTNKRVPAATPFTMGNGGNVVIETQTLRNAVTNAIDLSQIDAILDQKFAPTTYPADLSGNGGGSKLNRIG